jgi:hypothetical protein
MSRARDPLECLAEEKLLREEPQKRKIPGICGTIAIRFARSILSSIIFADNILMLGRTYKFESSRNRRDRATPRKATPTPMGCHRISSLFISCFFYAVTQTTAATGSRLEKRPSEKGRTETQASHSLHPGKREKAFQSNPQPASCAAVLTFI